MDIHNRKALKLAAKQSLTRSSYRLIVIHKAVLLGAALLITLVSFFLQAKINTTGGLSGIGMRNVLSTAQSAISLAGAILLPFWKVGILYVAIRTVRGLQTNKDHLLSGFYCFGAFFRLMLLRVALWFVLAFASLNASSVIFAATPFASKMEEAASPLLEQIQASGAESVVIDRQMMETLLPTIIPMIVIFSIVYLMLSVYFQYRLRMADYCIFDANKTGAFSALLKSWKMTRANTLALFRLDLSFWWFFVLEGLILLVSYGAELLMLLGISLPMAYETAQIVFYCLSIPLSLLLYWCFGMYLQATYAKAYDALLPKEE